MNKLLITMLLGIMFLGLVSATITISSPTSLVNYGRSGGNLLLNFTISANSTFLSTISNNTQISLTTASNLTYKTFAMNNTNVLNATNTLCTSDQGQTITGTYQYLYNDTTEANVTKTQTTGVSNCSVFNYINPSQDKYITTIKVWASTSSYVVGHEPFLKNDNVTYMGNSCLLDYNFTNTTIGCSLVFDNSYTFTLTNQKNLTIWTNSSGTLASQLATWDYKVFENSRTYNSTSYETSYESYKINVTANSSLTGINLLFNGTSYAMTNSSGLWSYSRDLPSSVVGNNSINFSFTYGSPIYPNSLDYQYVNSSIFTLCNTTYSYPFLNITFKDETTTSNINATIPTSTFEYYLGTGTQTKTYTFSNVSSNPSYAFCTNVNRTFYTTPYVQYASSGYPQRIWNPTLTNFTNSTTNQVLNLLSSSDGIYVTFQVVNNADQLLENVLVTATRSIGGSDVVVAYGLTSQSGTVVFRLSPDFSHTFNFSKAGYDTFSFSEAPTQTSYTITLSGGTSVAGYDYSRGISYSIYPRQGELTNDTIYNFNYTLSSSYWDVSIFGFSLRLTNGTILSSTSLSDNGGIVNVNLNTGNYTRIIMDYYYTINSTNVTGTTYWNVVNSANTQWSIKYFFTDLGLYLDSGMFGLDSFGKYLIIFLSMFLMIGIMSYKYGLSSPISIIAMIFAVVFFFDVVLGLLPTPINAIPHSLTYIALLILIVLIIKESQT